MTEQSSNKEMVMAQIMAKVINALVRSRPASDMNDIEVEDFERFFSERPECNFHWLSYDLQAQEHGFTDSDIIQLFANSRKAFEMRYGPEKGSL